MESMFSYDEVPVYDPRPHSSHTKIIRSIQDNVRVLDVGCATGYVGKELKRKNCYVVGLEISRDMADIAVHYDDEVIVADVENIEELSFSPRSFDVIVFGDVLEHLKRPDLVLINLKRYLKSDGFVIASIPNVAKLELRLKLLFGKFDYGEGGILSRSHLRFFTLATAKNFLQALDMKLSKLSTPGLLQNSRFYRPCLPFSS